MWRMNAALIAVTFTACVFHPGIVMAQRRPARPAPTSCSQPVVERVVVEVSDAVPLVPLMIRLSDGASPLPLARDTDPTRSYRWSIDLVGTGIAKPVPLTQIRPSLDKAGFIFVPQVQTVFQPPKVEDGRCTLTVSFAAIPAWRVQFTAEPDGTAAAVHLICEPRLCGNQTTTRFPTKWMNTHESLDVVVDLGLGLSCMIPLRLENGGVPYAFRHADISSRVPLTCSGVAQIVAVTQRFPSGGLVISRLLQ